MPSVHFISYDPPESAVTRYRCGNLVEGLVAAGWEAKSSWADDPELVDVSADVVVLHRLLWTEYVEELVLSLKEAGKVVIYGADDLVFSVDWPLKEASEYLPNADWNDRNYLLSEIRIKQELSLRAMMLCDCLLTSTTFIADRAIALGKKAFVVRNFLSEEQICLSTSAFENTVKRETDVVLGYLSGSLTHNSDFARLEPALASILERNRDVVLQIVGPVSIPPSLQPFAGRIRILPTVGWRTLPAVIASMDVNLASIDTSQTFNRGKSHLKWLEAAAVGVPTISSRSAEFELAISPRRNGFLADSSNDWEALLQETVSDADLRRSVGAAARQASLELTTVRNAHSMAETFDSIRTEFGTGSAAGQSVRYPRYVPPPPEPEPEPEPEPPPPPPKPVLSRILLYPFKWLGMIYRALRSAFVGEYPF